MDFTGIAPFEMPEETPLSQPQITHLHGTVSILNPLADVFSS
jgi:hypothetical protein